MLIPCTFMPFMNTFIRQASDRNKTFCIRVCKFVSLWVLCVLKTLWTPCLKYQWRKFQLFHQILVTGVFEFIDVPIRFWGQKIKDQGHSRQWPTKSGEYNISVTIGANFTKIRSHMYLGKETSWSGFRVKSSKVKVTAGKHNRRRQPVEFHLVNCNFTWFYCISRKSSIIL